MEQRIKFLNLFFLLCFLAIVGKLFYWQVINRRYLLALADNQYFVSLEIPTSRGKIFSSDNFPLVLNQKAYLLFADPQEMKVSPENLVQKIKSVVKEEQLDFQILTDKRDILLNKNLRRVVLAKDLGSQIKDEIENLKIEGLGFEEKEKRFYPEASMSAQLLGFVGENEKGEKKGYFGLEGYYDHEIEGQKGSRFFEKDALGRPVPLSEELVEKTIPGRSLVINIDRPLQFLVEKHLKEGIKRYSASSGLAVIMDPKNGKILSMASFPTYDPATFYLYDSEFYRNPTVSSSFEPGSIFKVIVMSAGIDSGAIDINETCSSCSGPKKIGEYTIKTWNEKYYPNSSMTDILVHSDNVGMLYVSQKLGKERLYSYLEKFGFGRATGIDLQGELAPRLRAKEDWREIDLATASFGQGIAVTPIQMITAVSAIANKGELTQPQIVREILDDSRTVEIKPLKKTRSVSSDTARIVTEMMVQAVEKGEAKWAKPSGYSIAGKTGTAQIPIAGHYDPEKTVASFVGFAPAYDPRFVMLIALTEPKPSPWGSETAAPLWFEITRDIFKLWRIPPG